MEFIMFFVLLIIGGGDTTRNLVAGGMCVLIEHPEDRAKLEADPSLLPTAIEEMLRYISQASCPPHGHEGHRTARVRVKKGDRAAMFYPSVTETRPSSPIPTVSTSPERRTRTWRSAVAERISVSARPGPGRGGCIVSEVLSRMKIWSWRDRRSARRRR